MQNIVKQLPVACLRTFAVQLLSLGGLREVGAEKTAELLVWADARGIESHGVMRIPRYVEMIGLGMMNPNAAPRFERSFGAIALLESDLAPGAVGMGLAMDKAIDLAKTHGIGWCSARNITHAGAIGFFAEQATRAGCIGMAMTASKPLMSYVGAAAEGVSTNPIAIAAPNRPGKDPIVFDMATSAVALGKIMAARAAGTSIPVGWGVDTNGADTTDAKSVKFLLPMAGAKGSGLSLMIEVLASVLVGNPLIASALTGNVKGAFNGLAVALNIDAFGDREDFQRDISDLATAIKALPKSSGVREILLPGERGYAVAAKAATAGISVSSATAASLAKLAVRLGVPVPDALQ
jgi:ureidoglycolate dehydrogenase (NAD+)